MPLAAALLGIVVASAHDYFYQQGLTGIGGWWDERWLPYATPLLVLSFLGVMVRRMVSALGEVEVLNQTLELRVLDRTQALVSANDAQARFLAAASHDLRQPMVAIGLLVGLLREQVVDPLQTALVAKVDQAVLALQDLLAGLTDLSRLDAGAVRAQAQAVDLAALFAAIRSHAGEAAARKDLRLELRIDPCPDRQAPGQPPLQVSADPVLLEQLLRNLIDNALRYTRRGGVLVRARALPNQQVRLEVWDSGPGIARADRQRVFEPFVRLREGGAGQGLGLAIVQRSAELMKAPITLRSRPGRGCCFSLTLPAMRPAPPTPPSPPREARWLAGRRILLVEDDAAVRDALVARLEAWGAQVDACKHLAGLSVRLHEAALAGHHAPRWDLMLTDLRLPDGQGYQAAEKLLTQQPGTPILLVTGNTAPAELAALAQSGLPVLHKPFRMEQLQQALVDLLKV
jgi:signal transduction histidine kinase/CheY-like chemotaxis protein